MTGSALPAAASRPDDMTGDMTGDTMTGWLSCNRLDPARCRALLDLSGPPTPDTVGNFNGTFHPDSDTALRIVADAFGAAFAGVVPAAGPASGIATWHLTPSPGKPNIPFTLDRGADMPPLVSLHWRATPADPLALAHEYGHAAQIAATHATGSGPMPPLAREVCAFLAELALLDQMSGWRDTRQALHAAHMADDTIYLGRDATALRAALEDPVRPYDHRWNYPPARILAGRLFTGSDRQRLAALYAAGGRAPAVLASLTKGIFP